MENTHMINSIICFWTSYRGFCFCMPSGQIFHLSDMYQSRESERRKKVCLAYYFHGLLKLNHTAGVYRGARPSRPALFMARWEIRCRVAGINKNVASRNT